MMPWRRWPWPFLLLVVGSALATARLVPTPRLQSTIILFLFLPGLLFDASLSLREAALRRELRWILLLGLLGAALAAAITLGLLRLAGFPAGTALLLAAALAATDPVSTFAALRTVHAHERIRVVLEGESLVNDGVAVVLFSLALAAVVGTAAGPIGEIVLFLRLTLGGIGLGLLIGLAGSPLLRRMPTWLNLGGTIVIAYGGYLLADRLGFSGLLTVIVSGLALGRGHLAHRPAIHRFWRVAGFVLSSTIFLLMGLQVRIQQLGEIGFSLLVLVVAVLLARALMVAVVLAPARTLWPPRFQAALVWAGLRGALSLALVLSVPTARDRPNLVALAFGFVFVSLAVQGLTIGPVFRALGASTQVVKSEPD